MTRLSITVDRRHRVHMRIPIELPISAGHLWRHLQDFESFICTDVFHKRVIANGPFRQGAPLQIEHRFLGFSTKRRGRVLFWQEGRGYAFSDLSNRDPQSEFPHVWKFQILAGEGEHSLLIVEVLGRWTLRALPRPLLLGWLWWIALKVRLASEALALRKELALIG